MKLKELISWVEEQGCPVQIKNKSGHGYQGLFYWNKPHRIVLFSKGNPKKVLFRTLIHEYCHYMQWQEKYLQKIEKLFNWQDYYFFLEDKKKLSRSKQLRALLGVLMLEHDCETRTINLIKEKGWPVNIQKYIRGANAYFYQIISGMKKKKGGPSLVAPYSLSRLLTMDELIAVVMRL